MKELVRYLLENMYLDFQGEISLDTVRQFLRTDDSREARQLLQKLIEDKGVDELLLHAGRRVEGPLADGRQRRGRPGAASALLRELIVRRAVGAAAIAACLAAVGCDAGHQEDSSVPVAPIEILTTNASPSQALSVGEPIEIAFDRLLLPSSITRQTFVLQDLTGAFLTPQVAYDPVARVVRVCTQLPPDQTYTLTITSPQNTSDPSGLRAIDGAQLDPALLNSMQQVVIEFLVTAGPAYTGADSCPGTIAADGTPGGGSPLDFCNQVMPLFRNCVSIGCHGANGPAEGLELSSYQGVLATAVGRVSQESNTGSRAIAASPNAGDLFGVDMSIIDPLDPSSSWMLYKLLMAEPGACVDCDGGSAPYADNIHGVAWVPLSEGERATLTNMIPGREMPFPAAPANGIDNPSNVANDLSLDELETMVLWILQGAPVTTCPM